jgi:hypothetical protein
MISAGWLHRGPILRNDVFEKIYRVLEEATRLRFRAEANTYEAFPRLARYDDVIFSSLAVHQDVVVVHDNKDVEQFSQDIIHKLLE